MDKTPAKDAAVAMLIAAVTDDAVRDRYPSGTTFVPVDTPWSTFVMSSRLAEGGSVVLVDSAGSENLVWSSAGDAGTYGAVARPASFALLTFDEGLIERRPNRVPVDELAHT